MIREHSRASTIEALECLAHQEAAARLDPAQALGILDAARAQQDRKGLGPAAPLVSRIWKLKDGLSSYVAAYVTLAEAEG
ncbi:hypothetical protein J5X07_02205 [Actinomyces bowdenii]|uniref:hypothetical protein n=1 Tax=Actinomyces bowdenii TaxID=131109 RepID=UPI001ABD02D0|nr:hypothetical protein [Actinomyces bowdenii]MBO3723856.1 hypothetical protein [Actinomyces bowdenii]